MPSFSARHGHVSPRQIQFRDELPERLRLPIYKILTTYAPSRFLREEFESILSPYGIDPLPPYTGVLQISSEEDSPDLVALKKLLLSCAWFRIYDLIERVFEQLAFHETEFAEPHEQRRAMPMERALNDYFEHAGIGWQLKEGKIISRSDQASEQSIATALTELDSAARPTAANHIREAVLAISKRPQPNTSGAVAHATSALECVLGHVTGDSQTLGGCLKNHPTLLHPAMKKALEGIYGFASDAGARHGKEGVAPTFAEAQMVVAICSAACLFISSQHHQESR